MEKSELKGINLEIFDSNKMSERIYGYYPNSNGDEGEDRVFMVGDNETNEKVRTILDVANKHMRYIMPDKLRKYFKDDGNLIGKEIVNELYDRDETKTMYTNLNMEIINVSNISNPDLPKEFKGNMYSFCKSYGIDSDICQMVICQVIAYNMDNMVTGYNIWWKTFGSFKYS